MDINVLDYSRAEIVADETKSLALLEGKERRNENRKGCRKRVINVMLENKLYNRLIL